MTERYRHQSVSGMYTFALLSFFIVLSMLLATAGVGVYKGVSSRSDEDAALRSTLYYIANKVRGGDAAEMIEIRRMEGVDVLTLTQDIEGERYETRVYFYDGGLYEVFCAPDYIFLPSFGDRIADISGFSMSMDGATLSFVATPASGNAQTMRVALRSEVSAS